MRLTSLYVTALTCVCFCCTFAVVIDHSRSPSHNDTSLHPRGRVTHSCDEEPRERILLAIHYLGLMSELVSRLLLLEPSFFYLQDRLRHHFGDSTPRTYEAAGYHFMFLWHESRYTLAPREAPRVWKQVPIWCRDLQRRCGGRTTAYAITGSNNPSSTGFVLVSLNFRASAILVNIRESLARWDGIH